MESDQVVIIGAGPAGLTAAYELVKQGVRPIILERADRVGGLARTESYKGYFFDIGGHRFFTKISRINHIWQEMGGRDFLKVPRRSRIFYRGRFFDYPLDLINLFRNLNVIDSILIPLSYINTQLRPYPEENTFDQWVSNRFGKRLFQVFFKTYTEKVWGIPCHRIKADWAAQRIRGLSLMTALIDSLVKTRNTKTLINEFDYPSRGPGMMWEQFQDAVTAGGGQVLLNSEVISIECEKDSVAGVIFRRGNRTEEIPAGHVISSMPVPRLVSMFRPKVPDNVIEAGNRLSYRAFIIIILILDQKHLFPDQWIYVHSPDVRVGRIQNFKNWSAAMVPDLNKTSIGMEYFCNRDDDLWTMSDKALTSMAFKELKKLGLAKTDDIIDSYVVRQADAYPVYDDEYAESLKIIKNFLGGIKNLQTIGRGGTHRYNNMDHSMLTAMLAVENYSGANHDLWEVNEEKEYLEEDKKAIEIRRAFEGLLDRTFARMDNFAFATAVGSVSGILVFLATIWLVIKGGDVVGPNLRLLAQYFADYTVTVRGSFIAFGYSFFWGFIFGWLFAYLRNLLIVIYVFWVRKRSEILSLRDFFDYL
jgi:protoporphyrinogen oxidase